jgi:beta-lactamase class A
LTFACSGDQAESGVSAAAEAERLASLRSVAQAVDSLALAVAGEVAVYYHSLGPGGDSLLMRPDVRMHAASMMKVPVLLQLFLDHDGGRLALDDSLVVSAVFASIVNGEPYELDAAADADSSLYALAGTPVTVRDLATRMIIRSSNLATNLLMQEVDAGRVTATLRALGADSMEVLRGVEDLPAYEAGLSNTTTARDLGRVFLALAGAEASSAAPAISEDSRREMLSILERQEFREKIPAGLPAGVRVANKTGWITRISHDAALVYPPADAPYVLVVLTRGIDDHDVADATIAEISRRVWEHHTGAGG